MDQSCSVQKLPKGDTADLLTVVSGNEKGIHKLLVVDEKGSWKMTSSERPIEVTASTVSACNEALSLDGVMVRKACDYIHLKRIAELEAKIKQQEQELRSLRRQVSLAPPVDTSPTKAQVQATALKGKSLLNPRVRRSKTAKKGGLFESDEEED